eukprot:snap_masked-scaffold408_size180710-processed-gene-0.7 protein:Tk05204 transcript:snap_masked-scaffold408_size180710-processed-gene-0.7-mRNA-1 annotation:"protein lethal2essential for life"
MMTKGDRQLQLDKRAKFFSDPIFQDIVAYDDKDLHRKLFDFKERSSLVLASRQPEAAHNLQVTCSNDKFMIQLELPGFTPEDFNLKTRDDIIILEANHEGKADGGDEFTSRKYTKEFQMPDGVQTDQLKSSYSAHGILVIEAPRQIVVPEGAAVSEAMAANSKAYTTDDGRTAVKEDSSANSQMIAATTESPDGKTTSTMSYSSSSCSSSQSTTTGPVGSMSFTMPPMRGMTMDGFGGSGGGQMSLDMSDMMKKMMGDMKMDSGFGGSSALDSKTSSGMTSTTSSSFSSSSMSSMQQNSSSMFGDMGMMGQPSLKFGNMGAMGNKLDIEELSNAGSTISSPTPAYTVTSPPPTTSKGAHFPEMTHSVQPTSDFKTIEDPQADHTVLLKLKEGAEYKLVLNMQQYTPDNITVKLNDRELSIFAHDGQTEDFMQRHSVPKGIDLDQLTSSFSEDGILVIRAPKGVK